MKIPEIGDMIVTRKSSRLIRGNLSLTFNNLGELISAEVIKK